MLITNSPTRILPPNGTLKHYDAFHLFFKRVVFGVANSCLWLCQKVHLCEFVFRLETKFGTYFAEHIAQTLSN